MIVIMKVRLGSYKVPMTQTPAGGPRPKTRRNDGRRQQTILVVDDQHVVLELVDAFLEKSDYRVYLAGSGHQALDIGRRLGDSIDLLLTDVRMPGMNGPELHGRLADLHSGLKVLFMSGFAASEVVRFGVPQNAPLIVKPFRPDQLLMRIRTVLAGVLVFPCPIAVTAAG